MELSAKKSGANEGTSRVNLIRLLKVLNMLDSKGASNGARIVDCGEILLAAELTQE
jgi:hypothetical protein